VSNIAKFFEDQAEEAQEPEPEKVKVGETEFTSEELEELVGAGRRLREIEEKQGQPVDEILTSWGKRGERIGEYKKKLGEYEKELEKVKNPPSQEQVNDEQMRAQVLAELKKYDVPTLAEVKEVIKDVYNQNRAGERMLANVNKVLRQAKRDGKPTAEPQKLLEFMSDPANPKDPEKAYKLMFEPELEAWKEERINKVKKPTMLAETKSTAGAKKPEFKVPSNREDLRDVLKSALYGEGGQ